MAPEICTLVPAPMQATSLALGGAPADQSLAVCQFPSDGPVHESVHSGSSAWAAAGRYKSASQPNATAAARIDIAKRTRLFAIGTGPP